MRVGFVAAGIFGALCVAASAQVLSPPANMDFESGAVGRPPPGWTVTPYPDNAAVTAAIDDDKPHTGHASATLTVSGENTGGALRRSIDAAPYRGKTVLLRAAIRSDIAAGGVPFTMELFARAYGSDGTAYPAGESDVTPGADWTEYSLPLAVPENAARIEFGFLQVLPGKSGFDNVSLRTVDPALVGWEAPRPLTPHGIANLHAFAQLLGYVRFFHPSDRAATADWDSIAIAGVQRVENAPDAAALVEELRAVFLPLAPTLRIYATGSAVPPVPKALTDPPAGATLIAWQHQGVDLGATYAPIRQVYSSKRGAVAGPAPDQAFAAALDGGVSILMPTTLYKDATGTLPHGASPGTPLHKPRYFVPSGADRATRLADVTLSWTVFQNFDPNFVDEPVDMPALLDTTLAKAAMDPDEEAFQRTLSEEVAALRDGHGGVELLTGKSLALPFWADWIEGKLVVRLVTSTSGPLKPGDVVDNIDGKPVAAIMAELAPTISASTPQSKMEKLLSAMQWNRHSANPVYIEAHRGGLPIAADLTPVERPFFVNLFPLKDVTELHPGIWYIDLRQLKRADLDAAMSQLAGAKAVIFDMRGYPTQEAMFAMTHLSDKPIRTQQFHVPTPLLPDDPNTHYVDLGWSLPPAAPRFGGRMIFLTDASAISQAEMFMSFVEDNHLGTIVGSTTAGMDGTINTISLPGHYDIDWTGTRALKLDGSRFQGVGVSPNIPVTPTIAGIAAGRDEVLEKGIEVAAAP